MAVMWPRSLPQWVVQDPRRASEREVYRRLDRELDDGWSVYYSRPWWGISRTGAEVDGEADFVVAHPDKGVLFVEVKGGLVQHDSKTSNWTSTDRFGVTHRIKDPMQQALKSKHELLKKFRAVKGWPAHRVRMRHGVVLPDCEPRGDELVGGYEQHLICFATECRDHLGGWVEARLASHLGEERDAESGPTVAGIAAIDATIAAPARLTVPLHRELEADMAQQDVLLTGAQLQAVIFIDSLPRVVVEGGAGTGKTLIASELANRSARAGRRTLLCCLSEALAVSLKRRIGELPGPVIKTLHELRVAASGGGLGRFNAVIVDEGQDVEWRDWDLVEGCLDSEGRLRVLFDSNQAVYRARDDLETRLQATALPLSLNLRNTRRIAAVTEPLYRGPLIQCTGAEGRPPVLLETSAANAPSRTVETVLELVHGQSLAPGDVAVLVSDPRSAIEIKSRLLTARLKTTDAVTRAPGAVVVETIARFKGLEAMAVVIMADRLCANNTELSYVGVSRARALLVVIGPIAGTQLGKALLAGGCEQVAV
jgi:nuclease-like protein/AAA domain-containing protein/UvrD-like helicase family protein